MAMFGRTHPVYALVKISLAVALVSFTSGAAA